MKKRLLIIVCACSLFGALLWLQPVLAQTLSPAVAPSTLQKTVQPLGVRSTEIPQLSRPALPDLVPVSCIFYPASTAYGNQNIRLEVRYRNAGAADALIGSRVYEWNAVNAQSGIDIGMFNTGSAATLKPGTDRLTNAMDARLPVLGPGTYTFTVRIDSRNLVAESNEVNNEMTCTLTILPPGGDLSIGQMRVDPVAPVSTQPFRVYVTVNNTGKEPLTIPPGTLMVSTAPFAADAYEQSGCVMQPGTGRTYLMQPTVTGRQKGVQAWTVIIDPKNRIKERTETNNQGTLSITVN